VVGDIPQQTVTQDEPDIYSVAYNNMNIDSNNHRFTKLRTIGVGNETWGATRQPGPHFTSDNWKLATSRNGWTGPPSIRRVPRLTRRA
jgi:hypothetical protein